MEVKSPPNFDLKRLGRSQYKNVTIYKNVVDGDMYYKTHINKLKWKACYKDEKEAAKAVDLVLIQAGLDPVNILKKK